MEPFVDVDAASIELTNKCAEGQIEVLGLLRDQGDPVAIPLSAWSFLEIRDQSPFGVIAASPNKLSTDASWWSTLRVRAEAVRLAWPPPQPQVARGYGSWALEGATYYARKARRLRRYPIQPPPPHDLAADGLPNRATTSLVEAVSWLASGRALSRAIWADFAKLESAAEEFAQTCKALSEYVREWRAAQVANSLVGESESEDAAVVRRQYNSAGRLAGMTWQEKKDRKESLRRALSAREAIRESFASHHREEIEKNGLDFVTTRAIRAAERELFDGLIVGELECRGRSSVEEPTWKALPRDWFEHPVSVRLNHNILEPSDHASVEDVKVIGTYVSPWVDLRIDTASLRGWRRATREVAPPRKAGAKASKLEAARDWIEAKYLGGIPPSMKNEAILADLKTAGIAIHDRTLRRALGRK